MTTPAPSFSRLTHEDRKAQILSAAVALAAKSGGLASLQRAHVAARAKCSPNLVNHYMGTRAAMISAIVKEAVRAGNLDIIGQAVIIGHAGVRKLDPKVKQRAISHTAGI